MPLAAARILRPVLYAPPSMPALDLLLKMQASHTHMALVIDEYGGTDGLVSIEDVMKSIVGDIEDEHDRTRRRNCTRRRTAASSPRPALRSTPFPRRSASISLRSARPRGSTRSAGSSLLRPAGFRTVAEILKGPGQFEFEVLDADPRRVKRLKIRPLPARSAKLPASPPAANAKPGDQA